MYGWNLPSPSLWLFGWLMHQNYVFQFIISSLNTTTQTKMHTSIMQNDYKELLFGIYAFEIVRAIRNSFPVKVILVPITLLQQVWHVYTKLGNINAISIINYGQVYVCHNKQDTSTEIAVRFEFCFPSPPPF